MGSFSWLKADELTKVKNVVYMAPFKLLIPEQFGGGYIKDYYQDYGRIGRNEKGNPKYDMYELLAFWNNESILKDLNWQGKDTGTPIPLMKEIDEFTDKNRDLGIDIGCYDKQIDRLKYPLKLVSVSYKGKYEDLEKPSYGDPDQGFFIAYRGK